MTIHDYIVEPLNDEHEACEAETRWTAEGYRRACAIRNTKGHDNA